MNKYELASYKKKRNYTLFTAFIDLALYRKSFAHSLKF